MVLFRMIHAESIKIRHTALYWLHLLLPMLGSIVFGGYYFLYKQVDSISKNLFVLELTAIIFPILIGTICGMISINEEYSGFQTMLGFQGNRAIAYLAKFMTLLLKGALSIGILIGLYISVILIFFPDDQFPIWIVIKLAGSIFIGNIIMYIICLFLSLRHGFGISIFVGIISSILTLLFSNFDVLMIGYYIPLVWGISFFKGILSAYTNQTSVIAGFFPNSKAAIFIIFFSIFAMGYSLVWFSRWEGRRE